MKKKFYLFSTIACFSAVFGFDYAKADELGTYWFGVGVGITETLCFASENGYMTPSSASTLMRAYRTNFAGDVNFRSGKFEEGVQSAFETYTSCRYRL